MFPGTTRGLQVILQVPQLELPSCLYLTQVHSCGDAEHMWKPNVSLQEKLRLGSGDSSINNQMASLSYRDRKDFSYSHANPKTRILHPSLGQRERQQQEQENADLLLTIDPLIPGGPGGPTEPRSP